MYFLGNAQSCHKDTHVKFEDNAKKNYNRGIMNGTLIVSKQMLALLQLAKNVN